MLSNERFLQRVTVDITTKCNLKCIMCPQHRMGEERFDMPLEVFKRIASGALPRSRELFFSCAYEALMSDVFEEILDAAKPAAVPEYVLISNATLLDEKNAAAIIGSGLNTLVISMDGATKTTYERIRRGAAFEATLERIQLFNRVKAAKKSAKPDLNLTYAVMKSNIEEMPLLVELAHQLGIRMVNFKPLQVLIDEMEGERLTPADARAITESLGRARQRGAELGVALNTAPELKGFTVAPAVDAAPRAPERRETGGAEGPVRMKRCVEPFPSLFVRPSGEVYPCTVWRGKPVGDFRHQDFEEIWNGEDFTRLRRELATGDFRDCCRECCYLV
ncbi:MAG: radical SAM protein [Endomicrobiales bacterium]